MKIKDSLSKVKAKSLLMGLIFLSVLVIYQQKLLNELLFADNKIIQEHVNLLTKLEHLKNQVTSLKTKEHYSINNVLTTTDAKWQAIKLLTLLLDLQAQLTKLATGNCSVDIIKAQFAIVENSIEELPATYQMQLLPLVQQEKNKFLNLNIPEQSHFSALLTTIQEIISPLANDMFVEQPVSSGDSSNDNTQTVKSLSLHSWLDRLPKPISLRKKDHKVAHMLSGNEVGLKSSLESLTWMHVQLLLFELEKSFDEHKTENYSRVMLRLENLLYSYTQQGDLPGMEEMEQQLAIVFMSLRKIKLPTEWPNCADCISLTRQWLQ